MQELFRLMPLNRSFDFSFYIIIVLRFVLSTQKWDQLDPELWDTRTYQHFGEHSPETDRLPGFAEYQIQPRSNWDWSFRSFLVPFASTGFRLSLVSLTMNITNTHSKMNAIFAVKMFRPMSLVSLTTNKTKKQKNDRIFVIFKLFSSQCHGVKFECTWTGFVYVVNFVSTSTQ